MADIHQLFDGMIATGHSNDQNGSPARPANYSDEALANRFTARHRDDLRFVNTWGRWLVWDGKRWQPDETLIVTDHARGLVRHRQGRVGRVVETGGRTSALDHLGAKGSDHRSVVRAQARTGYAQA